MSIAKPDTISTETKELAVAWMHDEISTTEARTQLGVSQVSQAVYKIGIALRQACRDGMVGKRRFKK